MVDIICPLADTIMLNKNNRIITEKVLNESFINMKKDSEIYNMMGSLVLRNKSAFVIVGYDFLNDKYIMTNLPNELFKPYITYDPKTDSLVKNNDSDITNTLKNISEKKDSYIKFSNIYLEWCEVYRKLNIMSYHEFRYILTKLHEIQKTIKSIDRILKYKLKNEEKIFYEREMKKQQKGLQRRLKRLYRYVKPEEYEQMINILEELDYPEFGYIAYCEEILEAQERNVIVYMMNRNNINQMLTGPITLNVTKYNTDI